MLICSALIQISSVQGLYQDEISLSFNWSKSNYYQGDSGSVTITLRSTCGNELEFTWVGIHFAWMRENYYYRLDLSSNPKRIPSGGSITFTSITFYVDADTSIGWNDYHVLIHYKEHHWYGWDTTDKTWTSSTMQMYIRDAYEKTYNELRPQVSSDLNNAEGAGYEGADAKSLISQASSEYDLALSLANQGKWEGAVTHLQTASNFLMQASAAEEDYWRQEASDSIDTAGQKIEQLADCECEDAKSLLEEAETKLSDAQDSYGKGTLAYYKVAYNAALQATNYADQASSKEQEYREEKQRQLEGQQQLMLIGGVAAVAIVGASVALMRRKPKPIA